MGGDSLLLKMSTCASINNPNFKTVFLLEHIVRLCLQAATEGREHKIKRVMLSMVISLSMYVSKNSHLVHLLNIQFFPAHKIQYWKENTIPKHPHIINVLYGMWLHIMVPVG